MLFTGSVSVMPVSPAAYAAAEDDVLQALKWTERNGEITITGCTKDLPQELVIPAEIEGKPVTALGAYAFAETPITSVVIPEGVRVIESNVFTFCTKLADVSLPASIEKIGQNVFSSTKWLQHHPYNVDDLYIVEQNILIKADILRFEFGSKAVIPDGIRYIAGGAFESCEFSSVTIPDSVKGLGDNAFDNCTQLLTVTVPEGVTEIGAQAFWICRKLEKLTILNPACVLYDAADTVSIDRENTFPGVIAGYEGSEAQVYAKKYNREFESLGEAPAPLPGDLNGDGKDSVDDAQNALRAYTNLVAHKPSGLAAYRTKAADTDGDGQITVSDVQYILQYYTMQLAGKAVTWEQLIRKTE